MSLDMRFTLDALLPEGSAWNPAPDGDFDDLLDGMGDNAQFQYEFLRDLAYIREPLQTPVLSDLEYEYGILSNEVLSDAVRRQQLHARVYAKPGFGLDHLQEKLQLAGFNLTVQANDPRVDPALLLGNLYWTVAQGIPGVLGLPVQWAGYYTNGIGPPVYESIAGWRVGGELIVNGPLFDIISSGPFAGKTQMPEYLSVAGNTHAVANGRYSPAGYFLTMTGTLLEYPIPEEYANWGLIFFVAESFSGWDTDPQDPVAIPGKVPNERREELRRIILQAKPLHSWCGLIVEYI